MQRETGRRSATPRGPVLVSPQGLTVGAAARMSRFGSAARPSARQGGERPGPRLPEACRLHACIRLSAGAEAAAPG